jgi:hypothetical protein
MSYVCLSESLKVCADRRCVRSDAGEKRSDLTQSLWSQSRMIFIDDDAARHDDGNEHDEC